MTSTRSSGNNALGLSVVWARPRASFLQRVLLVSGSVRLLLSRCSSLEWISTQGGKEKARRLTLGLRIQGVAGSCCGVWDVLTPEGATGPTGEAF
jgi:hypothetical protein